MSRRCVSLPGGGFACTTGQTQLVAPAPLPRAPARMSSTWRCADACGRPVRIEGARCAVCSREAVEEAVTAVQLPGGAFLPSRARAARPTSWSCLRCGAGDVEAHWLHAYAALAVHRRRCDLFERSAVSA